MKHALVWCRTLIALATALVMVPAVQAAPKGGKGGGGKPGSNTVRLTLQIHETVIDEHDTTGFYGLTYGDPNSEACSEANVADGIAFQPGFDPEIPLRGDGIGAGFPTVYDFGGPWAALDGFGATPYVDGADTGPEGSVIARFEQGGKVLNLDTRGTAGPRKVTINFQSPCDDCPGPAGDPQDVVAAFGSDVIQVEALLNIFLEFNYEDMGVCDANNGPSPSNASYTGSRACLEAGNAFAKLWFTTPAGETWRLDWNFLRVLRMDNDTWYFIGGACDGSQVVGLSALEPSKRKQPKTVFSGYYKIPFFFTTVRLAQ